MAVDHITPTPLPILQGGRSQTLTAVQAIEFPAYPVLQYARQHVLSNVQAIEFPAYPKLAPFVFSNPGGGSTRPTSGMLYPRGQG